MTRAEISKGDGEAALRRLDYLNQCFILPELPQAANLAKRLIDVKAVPDTEPEDAAHIAIATAAEVKYIVSWNLSHMVGPQAKRQLEKAIANLGFSAPLLATPEEIFEAEAPSTPKYPNRTLLNLPKNWRFLPDAGTIRYYKNFTI